MQACPKLLLFFRYSILLSCWFYKSSERPNFSELVEYLNRVIEHEPHPDHDDDRLQQNQDTQEFNRPYFVLEATSKVHCSANGSSWVEWPCTQQLVYLRQTMKHFYLAIRKITVTTATHVDKGIHMPVNKAANGRYECTFWLLNNVQHIFLAVYG